MGNEAEANGFVCKNLQVCARLTVTVKESGDHNMYVVKMQKVHKVELNDGRRLRLHLNKAGIICYVAPSPQTLFKFNPAALLGRRLADVIDMLGELENQVR